MSNSMIEITRKMKADSCKMAALDIETRNKVLKNVKDALQRSKDEIFAANRLDLENAEKKQHCAVCGKKT
ncbi:hypothetical protein [Ruminococcus sp. HUN007]|uniref:hypothetical protein n=1 Tax=Ruminococcus sp. HUN007 TaxID=1514668 RepID=UPI00325AE7B0